MLYNALVSGSLAYVLSEDSIYYAALVGILGAVKQQTTTSFSFIENDSGEAAEM